MTTSTSTNSETTTNDETKERSMDELLNVSYSEMTNDEVERVVEYRAEVKAKSELNQKQLNEIVNIGNNLYNELKQQRIKAEQTQQELLEMSKQRLAKLE